ncbi:MAG: HAMP domain-containing histidine kinase [Clostridia bacterium]|nr:HAMP domain-containing histidine kinase [Clostridia bacterium]
MKLFGDTDTKLKPKKSIKKRLLLYVFIILFVTYVLTTLTYTKLSSAFIIEDTQSDLQRIAEILEKNFIITIERTGNTLTKRARLLKLVSDVEIFDEFMKTETIIISDEGEIIYPLRGWDHTRLKRIEEESKSNRSFVYVAYDVVEHTLPIEKIIIIKRYEDLTILSRVGTRAFVISFGFSVILTLILGTLFSQKMYKPIEKLTDSLVAYRADKKPVEVYTSHDEIEVLATEFKTMTEALNEMDLRQKQFFQNSSHELKTPLMSIQGYAEAIKDGIVQGEELNDSLNVIISESQRLKNIVDDIIYISKIDKIKDNLEKEEHHLYALIEDAKEVVKPLIVANKLSFELICEPGIVILCDYEKMKRIFINLISNASRYAKEKIVVTVTKKDAIYIDVIDDGPGFEPGQEEIIFDRFYHGKKGGSGIGLSLTKELVEKHGGQIYAVNNINYGAIFKMKF